MSRHRFCACKASRLAKASAGRCVRSKFRQPGAAKPCTVRTATFRGPGRESSTSVFESPASRESMVKPRGWSCQSCVSRMINLGAEPREGEGRGALWTKDNDEKKSIPPPLISTIHHPRATVGAICNGVLDSAARGRLEMNGNKAEPNALSVFDAAAMLCVRFRRGARSTPAAPATSSASPSRPPRWPRRLVCSPAGRAWVDSPARVHHGGSAADGHRL